MGYVVQDVVDRTRLRLGEYAPKEWRRFLTDLGMQYRFAELPRMALAICEDDLIVFRNGITEDQAAYGAFHEAGHVCLHAGDARWWRSRPQGRLTLARFERQADEFAASFPVADEWVPVEWEAMLAFFVRGDLPLREKQGQRRSAPVREILHVRPSMPWERSAWACYALQREPPFTAAVVWQTGSDRRADRRAPSK